MCFDAASMRRLTSSLLSSSGRFAVHRDESSTGTLFGWFNDKESRGWRTAHSLCFRIDGNGGKFWVFFGALSDVEYTVTVTDTATNAVRTYRNAPGTLCGQADTAAF